ncbi:MAG: TadE/TadG family type IV pilus assembly protein [Methylocystis sp.]
MFDRLQASLRRYASDQGGAVAVLVALMAIPLFGAVGLALDYNMALTARAKLDQAADAAVIAGVTTAQNYVQGYTGIDNPYAAAIAAAKTQAQAQFTANAGQMADSSALGTPTFTFAIANATVTGSVTYNFSSPTYFAKLFGFNTMQVGNTVASSLTMKVYANIYIVLDVSESMGIGATAADQTAIFNATTLINGGCILACHLDSYYDQHYAKQPSAATSLTTEQIAHNAGATLRIDVAKSAIVTALNTLQSANVNNTYQVAVYVFSNVLQNVYPLSGNIAGAITAVNNIDMTWGWTGPPAPPASQGPPAGGTNITLALQQLNSGLPPLNGVGVTAGTALGYVMLISDAIQDNLEFTNNMLGITPDPNFSLFPPNHSYTQFGFNWTLEAVDPSQCVAVKDKGYTVLTLDVTYVIPTATAQQSSSYDSNYPSMFSYLQNSLLPNIPASMSNCATAASNAYSGNTPDEIQTAISQMFSWAIAQSSHLTQ